MKEKILSVFIDESGDFEYEGGIPIHSKNECEKLNFCMRL